MPTESSSRFVEFLTGDPDAPLHWRIIHDSNKSADAINRFGTISQLSDEFESLQREGYSPFAIINEGGHRDADISAVRAVFVDADDVPLPDLWHAPPAFLVKRDDLHWHAYWLVTDLPVARFREVQRRLAAHYGADRSVINESRVMRVPGFRHLKNPDAPVAVELVDMTGGAERWEVALTPDQVTAGLPDLPDNPSPEDGKASGKPVSADIVESMLRHVLPDCDRNAWIKVAAGIKFAPVSDPNFDGLDLFTRWSAGALTEAGEPPPNYIGVEDCAKTWDTLSCDRAGGAGFGSLAQLAIAGGYRGPVDSVFDSYDPPPDDAPVPADIDEDLFPAFTLGELDNIPDPVWLIRDVLAEESLGMTFGATGSLKTFLELDKTLCAAAGLPWAGGEEHKLQGFKPIRPVRTVFVAGEGARGLKRRIRAWGKRHGVDTSVLPILVVPVMPRFAVAADVDKLIRTIRARLPRPDHVVVDTLMWAAAGLNVSAPADSQLLLSEFRRVMGDLRCSLTFVHHAGRDKDRGHLGAENLLAGVDVVDEIKLEAKTPGRRTISVHNRKAKDGELRPEFLLEATTEPLGVDQDGRPMSSLVLARQVPRAAGDAPSADGRDQPRSDIYERLALQIINGRKGKPPIQTRPLAAQMVQEEAGEHLGSMTDGEEQHEIGGAERWLQRAATRELRPFAHKRGGKWVFGYDSPRDDGRK